MIYIIKTIYAWLLPPGIFIIFLFGLSVYLLRVRKRAALLTACFAVVFYLLSTEFVGGMLIKPLESKFYPPLVVQGDVVILLGGGAVSNIENVGVAGNLQGGAANRTLTAGRIAKLYNLPIIYTGGTTYDNGANEAVIVRKILKDIGISEQSIYLESTSLNTTQSVCNTKGILQEKGFKWPLVVTSAYHMPRSMLIFKRNDIQARGYPAAYLTHHANKLNSQQFMPSVRGLELTATAVREYLGIISLYIGYDKL